MAVRITFTLADEDADLSVEEVAEIIEQGFGGKRTAQPGGKGTRYESVEKTYHTITLDGMMVLHVSANTHLES